MSKIEELAEKYNLSATDDFWKHKQSGQWILTHNACQKIAHMEGIIHSKPDEDLSETDNLQNITYWVKGTLGDKEIWEVGEASPVNCKMGYPHAIAHKRVKDRITLALINAYEYDVSSEIEADAFKKPVESKTAPRPITNKQMNLIMQLELQANVKHHIEFDGLSTQQASDYIDKLNNMIKE